MKSFTPDRQPHYKATGYSGGFYPARIEFEPYSRGDGEGIVIVVRGSGGARNIILPLSLAKDLPNWKRCIAEVEHEQLLRQLGHDLKEEEESAMERNGCGKTFEEAQQRGKLVVVVGQDTYVLWDWWYVVRDGVLQPLSSEEKAVGYVIDHFQAAVREISEGKAE